MKITNGNSSSEAAIVTFDSRYRSRAGAKTSFSILELEKKYFHWNFIYAVKDLFLLRKIDKKMRSFKACGMRKKLF